MHLHHEQLEGHSSAKTPEETKALLAYMIHHNDHHAEELADLLPSMPESARKKLLLAIGTFESANVELQEVLDCLNEEDSL